MIPVVLATVAELSTLAGVTLGNNVRQVLLEHPKARRSANASGNVWLWSRRGGGAVTVTADDAGNVTRIAFVAARGEEGNFDLPCVGAFPVRESDVGLNFDLGKTACSAFNGLTYAVPDRSVVEVRFEDAQLVEAVWYRPSKKNPSPVGHMPAILDYLRPVFIWGFRLRPGLDEGAGPMIELFFWALCFERFRGRCNARAMSRADRLPIARLPNVLRAPARIELSVNFGSPDECGS